MRGVRATAPCCLTLPGVRCSSSVRSRRARRSCACSPAPGTRDRFTLRDKAATLVRLAEGASFRDASEFAGQRGGYVRRRGRALIASRDDRLARAWVSQYAPVLAEHYLPRLWPRTLVLDKLPVHVRRLSRAL
jgi:hypothetical protein